jgi:hypothetical protein
VRPVPEQDALGGVEGALTQLPPDKLAEVLEGAGAALDTMGGRFTVSMITVAIMAARAGTA